MGQKRNYSDLDVLLKDLKSDIKDTLSKEVFDEVRDIELEHVQRDVFDAYRPKIYNRRCSGGIDDPRNIVGQVDDMTLYVDNVTPYNPGYGTYNSGTTLADLIMRAKAVSINCIMILLVILYNQDLFLIIPRMKLIRVIVLKMP